MRAVVFPANIGPTMTCISPKEGEWVAAYALEANRTFHGDLGFVEETGRSREGGGLERETGWRSRSELILETEHIHIHFGIS